MTRIATLATAVALTGCQPPPDDISAPSGEPSGADRPIVPASKDASGLRDEGSIVSASMSEPPEALPSTVYLGRWRSSKGDSLVVTDPPRGGMLLEFTVDGTERRYPGSVTAEGLRFRRARTAETAGLVIDGKQQCLDLEGGETYCRERVGGAVAR